MSYEASVTIYQCHEKDGLYVTYNPPGVELFVPHEYLAGVTGAEWHSLVLAGPKAMQEFLSDTHRLSNSGYLMEHHTPDESKPTTYYAKFITRQGNTIDVLTQLTRDEIRSELRHALLEKDYAEIKCISSTGRSISTDIIAEDVQCLVHQEYIPQATEQPSRRR